MARTLAPLLLILSAMSACNVQDKGAADDTDPQGDTADTGSDPCTDDAFCDDGNPCNGAETCGPEGACVAGSPVVCDEPGETCLVDGDEAVCGVLCDLPRAPVLEVLADDEVLTFTGPFGIQTATLDTDDALDEAIWSDRNQVRVELALGPTRVLARSADPSCGADELFSHTYDVQPAYPGAAGSTSTRAIAHDDPSIVAWATGHADVTYGEAVDETWRNPAKALGPAQATGSDIVVLGRGGQITMTFANPITDGDGPDFAVFENGFSDTFLELAYVEVSSDGATFVRFDSAAKTPETVGAFGTVDPATVHGLAGVYRQGFGTPFDLSLLRYQEPVRAGQVDLSAITHVRLVDVVGDGSDRDSFDRPVHDPHPTTGSAGFDLDAVGVLNEASP